MLESSKWGLSIYIWNIQKQQQTTKLSVTVKALLANILWIARQSYMIELVLKSAHQTVSNDIVTT